jgi:alginate O-acetyltransferase complex protein AlgI
VIQNLDWWVFLALAPVVYWLSPLRFRPIVLTIASFLVIVPLAPFAVAFMVGLSLFVYFVLKFSAIPAIGESEAGLGVLPYKIGKVRITTWMFFVVLAYLAWYKYVPQMASQFSPDNAFAKIAIPLGISYFSFKLMHYALERGRGTLPPHNVKDFISWMFMMPTFTSGPIERFDHFQITKENEFRIAFVVEGLTRIAQGLVKRFVLVEQLGHLVVYYSGENIVDFADGVGGQPGVFAVWAYLVIALVVLYLDFSAYSDMAIGASRLFGFKIIENFNYPLLATNITEFWKRWHMSLTGWCRAYVYMPLIGITRNPYLAVMATFVLVGVWHAGTIHWLAWGIWHGGGQAVSLYWSRFAQKRKITIFKSRPGQLLGWVMTIAYVSLGGALVTFYHEGSFLDSFKLMGRAFGIA